MLQPGDSAPDFTLLDHTERAVTLSTLDAPYVLLYWYPKADTPGCTAQAENLRDQQEAFDDVGCVVMGASFDTPEDNRRFAEKYLLPFRLLSDTDHEVARSYGASDSAEQKYPRRIAHLIGAGRTVLSTYVVDDPEFFAETVLDDIDSRMRTTIESPRRRRRPGVRDESRG
jgi:peroxiredoxin Q/BCP